MFGKYTLEWDWESGGDNCQLWNMIVQNFIIRICGLEGSNFHIIASLFIVFMYCGFDTVRCKF